MKIVLGGGDIGLKISELSNAYIIPKMNLEDMGQRLVELLLKNSVDTIFITSGFLDKAEPGEYTALSIFNTIEANITAPIYFINLILKYSPKTIIIVFSSSVTHQSRKGYSVYAASKLGLEKFVENIDTVKVMNTSRVDTKLRWNNYEKNNQNKENMLTPKEVAYNAIYLSTLKDDKVMKLSKNKKGIICQMEKKLKLT